MPSPRPFPALLAGLLLAAAGCAAGPAPSSPAALPSPAATATVAPGVAHRRLARPEGPWAIRVVEVDPHVCGVEIGSAKGGDRPEGVEPTSALALRSGAVVALNADFFRARPFGVVEGPQVAEGEVVATEGTHGASVSQRFSAAQGVFGVTTEGRAFVGEGRVEGRIWTARGAAALARANAPPGPDSVALYNRWAGGGTPTDSGAVEVVARLLRPARAAGDTAVAVVTATDTLAAGVAVPEGGAVLAARGAPAVALAALAPGDTVRWTLPVRGAPGPVRTLVGGFPLLRLGGRDVLDRVPSIRPAFAAERHPRSAVGVRADGTVLLVSVDGRRPGHSAGMTLPELSALMAELGAVDALNLDGGGSTTLVVRGEVVNLPSDPEERPVTNAIVVRAGGTAEHGCRAAPPGR